MPTITLSFADGDRVAFAARNGETILAAARRAGIALSSDCEVGDCQTCRATCRSGEVEYDELSSISLTQAEVEAGEILPCVAAASTDLEVQLSYERGKLIPAKPFSIKVENISRLSASVVGLTARMTGLGSPKFLPGQYVHLQVPGTSDWRSYSFANGPDQRNVVEFFVRLLEDGVMSRYLLDRAAPGDVIQCRGPQGTFYLRGGARPVLMVAGGTGIAPMKSMLSQMVSSKESRPIVLCFGVNTDADLFLLQELTEFRQALPRLDLRVAVSQGASGPGVRSGLVTDLIDAESAATSDVYLCGPPAMTERARAVVTEFGAPPSAIFAEKFLPTAGAET